MTGYNGHRGWNAWNVSLWINNDEGLYREAVRLAQKHGIERGARHMAANLAGERTPDVRSGSDAGDRLMTSKACGVEA